MGIYSIRHSREHMRSHAQILNPPAREYSHMAGCEFSAATVLRPAALQSKSKRFLAAYGAGQIIVQYLVQQQPAARSVQ